MIPRTFILVFTVMVSCERLSLPLENQQIPPADILFSSIRNGQTIVLSDLGGNNQFPITHDNEDQWHASFVSAEGDIIYSAYLEGSKSRGIYRYDVDKMESVRIMDDSGNDSEPSLSNDGTMLAFTSNRNGKYSEWNIFTLIYQTNKIKQITFGDHHYSPCFSPDGSKILFSEYSNEENHLSIIDTNSTNYTKLESGNGFFSTFQFATSGNKIYYYTDGKILTCRLDGSDKVAVVSDSTASIYISYINPVDSILFYSSYDRLSDTYRLFKINLINQKKTILKESSERLNFGDCSSDGTKILYQQFVDGQGAIVLLDLERNTEKFISNSEYHNHSPKFNRFLF